MQTSCKKGLIEHPVEPQISFSRYEVIPHDDETYTVKLYINYTDGDGDIGLAEKDTVAPFDLESEFYYNLHTNYYEKVGGDFKQVREFEQGGISFGDTVRYNGRIPILKEDKKAKPIEGEIAYDIISRSKPKKSNTIKFDLWIYDRELHKSNVIETPEIVLN